MSLVSVGSVFILFLIFQGGEGYNDLDYSYNESEPTGPSHWAELYPDCGAPNQSPIDLHPNDATFGRASGISGVRISFFRNNNGNWCLANFHVNVTNDGHTAILRLILEENDDGPWMSSLVLGERYDLDYIQFRWGHNYNTGSEHVSDGGRTELEGQAVFSSKNGDLAVYSILYQYSTKENRALAALGPTLNQVQEAGSSAVSAEKVFLYDMFPPRSVGYKWYIGSMTSPPCKGNVTWFVDQRYRSVSGRDVEAFRKLKNKHGLPIGMNHRPVQPWGGRKVSFNLGRPQRETYQC